MKQILAPLACMVALAGCSTTDVYEKRADKERERQERYAERAVDHAPKWMKELPKSNSAVYENGSAVSNDLGMSVNKAKLLAFGKICMSAGGKVNQQSKLFRLDIENSSSETSELAVKAFCPGVDITGVEVVETKKISEGTRFRSYVLIALPLGDSNMLQKRKDQMLANQQSRQRSEQAFKEMDANQ